MGEEFKYWKGALDAIKRFVEYTYLKGSTEENISGTEFGLENKIISARIVC